MLVVQIVLLDFDNVPHLASVLVDYLLLLFDLLQKLGIIVGSELRISSVITVQVTNRIEKVTALRVKEFVRALLRQFIVELDLRKVLEIEWLVIV